MIRERLPQATIIAFWHIPWPNAERIGICPWRDETHLGLLGASVVGFHTQQHCNNFIDSVDAFMESRIDRENQRRHPRAAPNPRFDHTPISIEWPVHWLAKVAPSRRSAKRGTGRAWARAERPSRCGVDRLDYTKGIEERLSAVDELLTRHPEYRGRFTFVQIAAPSRTKIPHYLELNSAWRPSPTKLNGKWSAGAYRPIVLLRSHHEPAAIFRYYRASELCYVSSLHDGMNLVAKEFVAARDDERGRSRVEPIYRGGARSYRGPHRQSLRFAPSKRGIGLGAADAGRRATRANAIDEKTRSGVQRLSMGGKDAGRCRRASAKRTNLRSPGRRSRGIGRGACVKPILAPENDDLLDQGGGNTICARLRL